MRPRWGDAATVASRRLPSCLRPSQHLPKILQVSHTAHHHEDTDTATVHSESDMPTYHPGHTDTSSPQCKGHTIVPSWPGDHCEDTFSPQREGLTIAISWLGEWGVQSTPGTNCEGRGLPLRARKEPWYDRIPAPRPPQSVTIGNCIETVPGNVP